MLTGHDDSDPRNLTDVLLFRYGADPFNSRNETTPGPLAVLVNAMLGNESWFYQIRNATTPQEERDAFVAACVRGLPFSTYTGYVRNGFATANGQCSFLNFPGSNISSGTQSADSPQVFVDKDVSKLVASWFSGFGYDNNSNINNSTVDVLEAGMYLANEALLGLTADASRTDSARPVYVSNGTAVTKPSMRYPAKATVSFLMLLEVGGLAALAVFTYRMPTFASRLDAVHVATIGAQLCASAASSRQNNTTTTAAADLLPPLGLRPRGLARQRYLKELEDVGGLIGCQEEGTEEEGYELAPLVPSSRSAGVTPRTSATLTPAASLYHHAVNVLHPQPQGPSSSMTSTTTTTTNNNNNNNNDNTNPSAALAPAPAAAVLPPHTHTHRPLSGAQISPPFNPRPLPRPISFASTAHTTDNDDVISALDAVSEAGHADDPDAPPKYGDVMQADALRFHAAPPPPQRRRLVVGGPGRITREMARVVTSSSSSSTSNRRNDGIGVNTARRRGGVGAAAGRYGGGDAGMGNNNNNNNVRVVSGTGAATTTATRAAGGAYAMSPVSSRNRGNRSS